MPCAQFKMGCAWNLWIHGVHLLHSYCMINGLAWIGNLWLVSVVVGSLLIRVLGPGSRYDNFSCRILFQLAVM